MMPASYNVRDLVIRPATVLAPMAGVTDTLFRRVIRGLGGCGLPVSYTHLTLPTNREV